MGNKQGALSREEAQALIRETGLDRSTVAHLHALFRSKYAVGAKKKTKKGSSGATGAPSLSDELGREEFKVLLEEGGFGTGDDVLDHIFDKFDLDGNGFVSLKEFLTTMSLLLNGTPREKLEFAFSAYDVDDSGTLTTDEIEALATHMKSVHAADALSTSSISAEHIVDGLLAKLDSDGDGVITLEEWVSEGLRTLNLLPLLFCTSSWEQLFGESVIEHEMTSLLRACKAGRAKEVMKIVQRAKQNGDDEMDLVNCGGQDGETPLLAASCAGDASVVSFLLAEGADATICDYKGRTPLHRACAKCCDVEVVRLLVDTAHCAIDHQDGNGCTPLHAAAHAGAKSIVLYLVSLSSELPMIGAHDESMAVHMASRGGHVEVVDALLSAAPQSLNATMNAGFTPLMFACQYEHPKTALLLIEKGAETHLVDRSGKTALMLAARAGCLDIVQALCAAKVDPTVQSCDGATACFLSAQNGHVDVTKFLMNMNATVAHMTNHQGLRPVDAATPECRRVLDELHLSKQSKEDVQLLHCAEKGDTEGIQRLLASGANPNVTDSSGNTPLWWCILRSDRVGMETLLSKGANGSLVTSKGAPLHAAVLAGRCELVRLLLHHGADVGVAEASRFGMKCIHSAAIKGYVEMLQLLCDHSPQLMSAKSADGGYAIHWAAGYNRTDALRFLLAKGVDVLEQTNNGSTALHIACKHGAVDCAMVLLEAYKARNIDMASALTMADHRGRTPTMLACIDGHIDLMDALVQVEPSVLTFVTPKGTSIWHVAAASGRVSVLQHLGKVESIADLMYAPSTDGTTPFHRCCRRGVIACVTFFLDEAGDGDRVQSLCTVNACGENALNYAARGHHTDVITLLRNRLGMSFAVEQAFAEPHDYDRTADAPQDASVGDDNDDPLTAPRDWPIVVAPAAPEAGMPEVKWASADAMFSHWLSCFGFIGDVWGFSRTFMLTYRLWWTPSQLLERLLHVTVGEEAYEALGMSSSWSDTEVRDMCLSALLHWIRHHSYDFEDPQLSDRVALFLDEHVTDDKEAQGKSNVRKQDLYKEVRNELTACMECQMRHRSRSMAEPPSPASSGKGKDLFSIWKPKEIAQQLALLDEKHWNALKIVEFYNSKYSKKDKDLNAPHVMSAIRSFNQVSAWVKTLIVQPSKPKKRWEVICKLLDVARDLEALRSFPSLLAIGSSLQSPSIDRLKRTWAFMSSYDDYQAMFTHVRDLCSPVGNHKAVRAAVASATSVPCVPFLGIVMGDLIFVEEQPKRDAAKRVNVGRCREMARALYVIVRYQTLMYSHEEDPHWTRYWHSFDAMTANEAQSRSLEVEPRKSS